MEQICRICFKFVQNGKYEIIGEIRKEMFEVLLLKLNLEMSEETIICSYCTGQLDETFQFKAMCLYTEDCIYPFVDQESDTKLDMREVYYKNDKRNVINIEKDEDVCRLCMGVFHNSFFCTLEKAEKDVIKKYIPEVNIDATLQILFCKTCARSLTYNFSFIMKCLQTEEKIKSYRDNRGICDNSRVKLPQIIQNARENRNEVDNINLKDLQYNMDGEVVTDDEAEYSANDDDNLEGNIPPSSKKVHMSSKKEPHSKPLTTSQKRYCCEICQNQFKTQPILQSHIKNVHRSPSKIYRCEKCPFKSRYKITKDHMVLHMEPSELKLLPCELCSYKARRSQDLKKHLLTHMNISKVKHFSCSLCPYKTKTKYLLWSHEFKHKNLSEIPTFNCYQCPYKAKIKARLRKHMIECHQKDPKLYSCDKCNMTTKYVCNLKKHALIHKDKSETPIYGCDKCTYETKIKGSLTQHKEIHSDLKPYKCEICLIEFKRIPYLRKHQLSHKSVSEVPIYKCLNCSYQSKRKENLVSHLKTHKN